MNCFDHRGVGSVFVILLLLLAACTRNSGGPILAVRSSTRTTAHPAAQHLSLAGEAAPRRWIDAGYLPDLRWPNFSDYRLHVKHFYQPAGYVLAWVRDGQPILQALAVTNAFQHADRKGLNSEDYDASRWAARIARLRPSNPAPAESDLAKFDLALTVCAMRYISDLHIGKVNPRTFRFGLDIEHKKYDLPHFLRQRW
jgi:L,D-transpeptidase YcbB